MSSAIAPTNKLVKYFLVEFTSAQAQVPISVKTDEDFYCDAVYLKRYGFTGIPADGVVPTMPYTLHFNMQISDTNFNFDSYMRNDGAHGVPLPLEPGINTIRHLESPILLTQRGNCKISSFLLTIQDDNNKPAQFVRGYVTLVFYGCREHGMP